MILTCPECSTQYMAKADAIGANGRTVRCAKCEATWFVSAEDAQAELLRDKKALDEDLKTEPAASSSGAASAAVPAAAAAKGAHVTQRDKADAEKLSRRRKVIMAIWLIPLLLLIAAAALAYAFRQEIVNRVPEAATIYQSFGVKVKTAGLEIENPTARTAIIDGQTVLVINSAIRNISPEAKRVPMVQLSLHNGAGEALAQWFVEPDQMMIGSNDRLEFASQYPDPPVDAVKLRYDFAADEKI